MTKNEYNNSWIHSDINRDLLTILWNKSVEYQIKIRPVKIKKKDRNLISLGTLIDKYE